MDSKDKIVKCPNCGSIIPDNVSFHTCSCGKRIRILTKEEYLRKQLNRTSHNTQTRNYINTVTCKCYECGYEGTMGVLSYDKGIFSRIIGPILIYCIATGLGISISAELPTLFLLLQFGGGAFAYYIAKANSGKVVHCPSCNRELHTTPFKLR